MATIPQLTQEQYQIATLKLLSKQCELLEAIDWKLWQLHEKYVGEKVEVDTSGENDAAGFDLNSLANL
jgi:hypothetical protein